jgi:hypothetical protein
MAFTLDLADTDFATWLASVPTEDELRDAYVRLETARSGLWTAGHHDSFRRDRYELDARYVDRLVRIKWALARRWEATGQFDGLARSTSSA